jgi:hypothetical protein
MRPEDPAAVSRRFAELVIRAQAQAARQEREHLLRLAGIADPDPARLTRQQRAVRARLATLRRERLFALLARPEPDV